ncbi:carbon-monoxide dehydrogenase large subunit [Rubricella aquisinus]|uniref:Carbon-monoxide dehydrogenase large subunit n=1 Tax=Rubricella aquisinus TaxID=2028108 RepID=A0A840X5V2_9RHOB|nr:xanthine dehydrogenase family protein molybdopterin-binding subunit [Rubricella aquisinus]MBB5517205.1 carbon-monoxide dehydrogenase large subunit [Rubricella aquisinus]
MSKFGVSQPVRRVEDTRFLTGKGRYVDDIAPENAGHVAFVRSPVAHGTITSIDVTDARDADGVIAVITAADLEGKLINSVDYSVVKNRDGTKGASPIRPIIAGEKVVYAGEIVAAVLAETRAQAVDAAELVMVEIDDLPVHVALGAGGPTIHDVAPDNRAYDWAHGDEAANQAAFESAAHTVSLEVVDNRVFADPMEPRGAYAEMVDGRLHVAVNGQGVWGFKKEMAKKLGIPADQVRVTNPDVGGGFGMKGFSYPEQFVVGFLAHHHNRPVRWMADRSESHLSDAGGRDLVTTAEAAFDADHRLVAVRMHARSNLGAHNSPYGQFIQSELAQKVFTGVYDVQNAFFHVEGFYTNTTPIDAYRGAGRPEAIYVVERLMDYAARVLGVDPVELRRKNFIKKSQFPYISAAGQTYDVGDFERVLDRALVEADIPGFAARKAESAARGKLRGLGLSYYIESILGAMDETTKIAFAEDGSVELFVGTQSNGQGHETVFAQILHQRTGIPFDKIRFVQGDSDRIAKGGGTGGSRSVTMQGNSINMTADEMIRRFEPLAEDELEVSRADIVFEEGAFRVAGTDKSVTLMTLADKARLEGRVELLTCETDFTLENRSFPNGAHFAEVEIDPATGVVRVDKYTVVDDFGVLMNPMLAEGQVHGGVVQGIGQALMENVVYDADGQLLSGSFMDYAMPRADDVPMMPFHSEPTPSTANEIGMKGCGEAGTVGALAAVVNAALDAVWDEGVHEVQMPLTPLRMWSWLQGAGKVAAE